MGHSGFRGNFITKWGSQGSADGQFIFPVGIDTDSQDNVYVVDNSEDNIQKFTSDGNFITKWGSYGSADGQLVGPRRIATDSDSNVYVIDHGNHRIQKFTNDGNFITKWGSRGIRDGQFESPYAIATDSNNNVYVVDGNPRIQKFTSNGQFITKWGSVGSDEGQFNTPSGIATDSNDNVYVVDSGNQRIQKFDSNGNFVTKWGSFGANNGQLYYPDAIDVGSNGNVYVSDSRDRIQVFAPNTRDTEPPEFSFVPGDITVEASSGDGSLVEYPQPNAIDDVDGKIVPECNPPSGSLFAIGITQVECTATDSSGNSATATFNITVQDTTPPTFTSLPSDIVAEATSSSGAAVSYSDAVAVDAVDGPIIPVCTPPSGSVLPLGNTPVECTATDSAGNIARATFSVTVQDVTPPTINTPPSPVIVKPTNPNGAIVQYTVTANDIVDGAITPTCTPPSGSSFPIGDSTITCTAIDSSDNTATAQFVVRVQDSSSIAPETQITTAVDGNNVVLPLDGNAQTTSTTISISFTAIDDMSISGFQCSLDGIALSSCDTSPVSINNVSPGMHTFQIAALDTSGNIDPTPAVFSWTVVTITPSPSPTQTIQTLIDHINSIPDLPSVYRSGFNARLNAAIVYLSDQNPSNDIFGACGQINAFIQMVDTYASEGRISTQLASELIQTLPYSVQAIKSALGCGGEEVAFDNSSNSIFLDAQQSQQIQPQLQEEQQQLLLRLQQQQLEDQQHSALFPYG